jgi:hypothetical protein
MTESYIASLEEDSTGELVLPLDPDMLADLGWSIGDELVWSDNGDGTYIISKVSKTDANSSTE